MTNLPPFISFHVPYPLFEKNRLDVQTMVSDQQITTSATILLALCILNRIHERLFNDRKR